MYLQLPPPPNLPPFLPGNHQNRLVDPSTLDAHDAAQREGIGNVGDGQRIRRYGKRPFFAVDRDTQRFEVLAVEHPRLQRDGVWFLKKGRRRICLQCLTERWGSEQTTR